MANGDTMAVELNATVSVASVKTISAELDIKINDIIGSGSLKSDEAKFKVKVPGTGERIRLRYQYFYSPVLKTVKLYVYNDTGTQLPATATFSVVKDGLKVIELDEENIGHILEKEKHISGFIGEINLKNIMTELLRNDSLELRLEIRIMMCCRSVLKRRASASYNPQLAESETPAKKRAIESLVEDVGKMRETMPDVTLQCQGDTTERSFLAHRAFLSARSTVFAGMLKNTTSEEARTGKVKVKMAKPETLEAFLTWIYASKLPSLDIDEASDLLYMADYYDVCSLKKVCKEFVLDNLSEDTLVHVVVMAHLLKDDDMKTTAITRMCLVKGGRHAIADFDQLKKYPDLLLEILDKVMN